MEGWTRKSFEELKKEYEKAVDAKDDVFLFQGQEILVSYAKYLIEYLDTQFKMQFMTKNQIRNHMLHCQYMIEYCKRQSNDKKPHYFQKQLEVAKRKLKTL